MKTINQVVNILVLIFSCFIFILDVSAQGCTSGTTEKVLNFNGEEIF